jgi:hypothetical protein
MRIGGGDVKVVRQARVSREIAGCFLGDFVMSLGKKWVVVDTGEKIALEEIGGIKLIPEEQIARVEPVVIFRPDLPHSVELTVGKGLKGAFSVSSLDFKGKRVFPGDVIEVNEKRFVVAGYLDGAVWVEPGGREGNLMALQPQGLLDLRVVRIVTFLDEGIRYTGN